MEANLLQQLQPYAIALALGLLIGIERERSHPPGFQPLGLRTFVLFSMLGALAANIGDAWLSAALTIFVGAIVVAGYLRSSSHQRKTPDIGITTEVAALVTFALGYLANKQSFLALVIGVVVLVVLLARTKLHRFSRNQIKPVEVRATVTILVLAVGIIPLLPDRTVDPWNFFNPFRFGSLILIIALMQYGAYVGIRIFGTTYGVLLSGFLAGFVSSTVATVKLAESTLKKQVPYYVTAYAVILATVAMFIKMIIVILVASPGLFKVAFLPAVFASIVMSAIFIFSSSRFKVANHYPPPKNPLALLSAAKLAMFLLGMLVMVKLADYFFGSIGMEVVSFMGGFAELHAVVLAIAALYQENNLSVTQAINNIGIAVMASFISKIFFTVLIVRNIYALLVIFLLSFMAIIYGGVWIYSIYYVT